MDREAVIDALRKRLDEEPGEPLAAYLFGSVARGTSRATSDVDVALLYRRDPGPGLSAPPSILEDDLERALGVPVQVVVLNSASADLVHRVLRDGRLLLDRDRAARIRFEVKARNEYFDLLPILDRYRRVERAGR